MSLRTVHFMYSMRLFQGCLYRPCPQIRYLSLQGLQNREREQGLQYLKETLPQNPMQVNLLDIHREKRKELKIRKVQKKVQKTLRAAMTIRTPRTRQIMRRQPKALRKRLKMQSSREINQVINIKEMIMTV